MKEDDEEYLPSQNRKLMKQNQEGRSQSSKKRMRLKGEDKKTSRYECFCNSQYLSYSALYCHLKKKHLEFFQRNRTFNSTNIIVTIDPTFGYKIKKLFKEKVATNPPKSKPNPSVPAVQPCMRPQYEFDAVQIEINQSLRMNELKKRTLQINQKILKKQEQLLEELQKNMEDYEDIMHLLRIQQISDVVDMKLQEFSDSQEDMYFPDQ